MNVPRTRSITARLILIVSLLVIPVSAKATIYWNLFNSEGDITSDAIYVTYATLDDMLNDTNRTGFSVPDGGFAGTQIIGAGATLTAVRAVPEPATWAMMLLGLGAAGFALRGRRRLLQRPA